VKILFLCCLFLVGCGGDNLSRTAPSTNGEIEDRNSNSDTDTDTDTDTDVVSEVDLEISPYTDNGEFELPWYYPHDNESYSYTVTLSDNVTTGFLGGDIIIATGSCGATCDDTYIVDCSLDTGGMMICDGLEKDINAFLTDLPSTAYIIIAICVSPFSCEQRELSVEFSNT